MALTFADMVLAAQQQLTPQQFDAFGKHIAGTDLQGALSAYQGMIDTGQLTLPGFSPTPSGPQIPPPGTTKGGPGAVGVVQPPGGMTTLPIDIPLPGVTPSSQIPPTPLLPPPPPTPGVTPIQQPSIGTGGIGFTPQPGPTPAPTTPGIVPPTPGPITPSTPPPFSPIDSSLMVQRTDAQGNVIDPSGNFAPTQTTPFGPPPDPNSGASPLFGEVTNDFTGGQQLNTPTNQVDILGSLADMDLSAGANILNQTGATPPGQPVQFSSIPNLATSTQDAIAQNISGDPTSTAGPIIPTPAPGSVTTNINTPTPVSQLNTFEVPTDVFPTSTSQSTNFGTSGSSSRGQSTSGSESGGFSSGRSFAGIDFNNPLNQAILPDLISSATGLQQRTNELGSSLNDMFANQMRRAFAPENFQGLLNSLSNRNVLNSDITSDALSKASNLAAKTIADKSFEAQVAQAQNQLAIPSILGNLANLGQVSTSQTDAANRASSFSDAFNLSDAFSETGGQSSSLQQDPSKPFDIMSRLLTF